MDWIILYKICDTFNGRYRIEDDIGERFNGKGGIGDGFNSTALAWLAVCDWIVYLNIFCGIDDTDIPTEKAYQINDGLSDTLQDRRSLQRRRHWKWIQRQIKGGRYFELVCLAGSVWLDTQSQYCGINDTPTTTTKTYQINNRMILYTRGDEFNGRYWIGDGIKDRFNGVANIGWFDDHDLNCYFSCHFDCGCNCNFDFVFNFDCDMNGWLLK